MRGQPTEGELEIPSQDPTPVDRRPGLQREVLASLALVMGLATLVLVGLIVVHHERMLRATLGPALLAEARAGSFGQPVLPGTRWWEAGPDGRFEPRHPGDGGPDAEARRLAEEARAQGAALLRLGGPSETIRFAAPVGSKRVAVAQLPESVSRGLRRDPLLVIGVLGAADLAVFAAFAALLLRRRVVQPLSELAAAARAVGRGEAVRAPVAGPRETAEVARAWNEMTEALEKRSEDLAKAVTELRHANRELRRTRAGLDRAERLAVVGRLAAGVAHEVGNPIGAILAFIELAGRDPGLAEASRGHLERAAREGGRVRTILRQLLDFSRPVRPAPVPLAPAAALEEARALVAAQPSGRRIRFETQLDPAVPLAFADPGAVLQILLNLLLNAADAVQDVAEPVVRLECAPALLRSRPPEVEAVARTRADAVEIRVSDNGAGIAEADRDRVFDPFFTTKPPGHGTGLGLSTALRLAEEMEGQLGLAAPAPGFATSFALRLPSVPAEGAGGVRRAEAPLQAASQCAGACSPDGEDERSG
jgi:signal transduction histidine kinase